MVHYETLTLARFTLCQVLVDEREEIDKLEPVFLRIVVLQTNKMRSHAHQFGFGALLQRQRPLTVSFFVIFLPDSFACLISAAFRLASACCAVQGQGNQWVRPLCKKLAAT